LQNNEGKPGFLLTQTNDIIEKQTKPILIPALKRIVQISAGNNFCLALDADGKVYSWGMSEQNQLGRRLIVHRHQSYREAKLDVLYNRAGLFPGLVALQKRKNIVSIHAGSDHAFAIDSNGDTWAWGLNNFGQTGISGGAGTGGATIVTPQKVQALTHKKMKMIQGGSHHSIGITQAGECLVWGRVDGGQMGLDINALLINNHAGVILERGKPRILVQPTALPISGSMFATAGSDHNILITSQGEAYSWGFNTNYQCGQGDVDEVCVATLINNSAVRDKILTWAGAGGQYSLLAGPHQKNDKPLTNGIH
jgi:regulator of chromosome condensation